MLNKEALEARRTRIGSSDVPSILGLDHYRSAADVWLEKTGRVADWDPSIAAQRGNLLEPVLLDWAAGELGVGIQRDLMLFPCPDDGIRIANLDGITQDGDNPKSDIVEAKTTVLTDDWGDPMTDQVPERVLAQVHHQFAVAGPDYRVAWVPVLMPGFRTLDFRLYRIERNDELCEQITEAAVNFMNAHVLTGVPPADFRPSLEVLKRANRVPEKVVEVEDSLFLAATAARQVAKEAAAAKKAADADLLAAIGDAEGGVCGLGSFSYMTTDRKGYTVKATSYRAIRLKAKK